MPRKTKELDSMVPQSHFSRQDERKQEEQPEREWQVDPNFVYEVGVDLCEERQRRRRAREES